jgi:hypothetical protein
LVLRLELLGLSLLRLRWDGWWPLHCGLFLLLVEQQEEVLLVTTAAATNVLQLQLVQ